MLHAAKTFSLEVYSSVDLESVDQHPSDDRIVIMLHVERQESGSGESSRKRIADEMDKNDSLEHPLPKRVKSE